MSFNFNSPTTGVLTYNVGTVTVVKNIVRQSWRIDNLGGNYIGGVTASSSGCFDGTNEPILVNGELTVAHAQPTLTMVVDFFNSSGLSSRCTYTGTYSQAGSLGAISGGTYSCSIGTQANVIVGTFTGSEISNTRNGFSGRFNAQDNFCTGYSGFFGGVKDVL